MNIEDTMLRRTNAAAASLLAVLDDGSESEVVTAVGTTRKS